MGNGEGKPPIRISHVGRINYSFTRPEAKKPKGVLADVSVSVMIQALVAQTVLAQTEIGRHTASYYKGPKTVPI